MPRLLTSAQWPHLLTLWGMLLWLTVGGYNRMEASATGSAPNDSRCPLGAAVETQGYRRLALIVGVGDYKNPDIRRLQGAPHDAQRFYALLTGPHGYDFPKENVCVLLDAAATTARFRQAFDQALVARARAKDVVVVYFAGHGSRTKDTSGDEPDGWDETLVLHDARTGGVGDLVDDELQDMLTQLYAKTQDITVILDSCHSGTATREETDTAVARYVPPAALPATSPANSAASGGRAAGWVYAAMPGLVVFTAASDGTSAWERDGRGVFTDALLQVLAPSTTPPLTYAQAARQIAPLVAARRYQIPYFQGELTRPVFSNAGRLRPVAWEVIAIGPPIRLGGPPLPGLGPGAEMRIYDGTVTGAETRDPGKAKATVILDATTELNATGHTATPRSDAPPIGVGDVAVLARPAESLRRIKLRVRPVPEPGGIPEARAAAVRSAIATHHEARMLVELAPEADDFELLTAGCNSMGRRRGGGTPIRRMPISPQISGSMPGNALCCSSEAKGGQSFATSTPYRCN